MNPTIFGVIGPGFLNQVPTLYSELQVQSLEGTPEAKTRMAPPVLLQGPGIQ